MGTQGRTFNLEDRLLAFSVRILRIVDRMHKKAAGVHIGNQLLRAGTSPLFNQGDAQSAESPGDFVHKMKIYLKELRETRRALLLVQSVPLINDASPLTEALAETKELIRIFFSSIRTAKQNMLQEDSPDYCTATAIPSSSGY